MRLVQALDRRRRVTAVPFQRPDIPEALGLSVAECEAAAWAVAPDGRRYRGAGAINAALSVALGTSAPLRVYRIPGLRHLQDALYAWIARNRHRLPGVLPYCEEHPVECR